MTGKELGAQRVYPLKEPTSDGYMQHLGMSLRQHYAGLAMQTVLAGVTEFPDENWRVGVAVDAILMADALLERLARDD